LATADNGPPRLKKEAAMRIMLAAAVMVPLVLAACSSDRAENTYVAPKTVSISVGPTSTLIPTASSQLGPSGFGAEAVQLLLGYLRDDAAKYGWVAGCLWDDGVADSDTLYPARLLGLDLSNVASGTWGFGTGIRAYHVATIYHPGATHEPPATDFVKTETSDHLCYSPAP
jgi:hypothetical protein